MSTRTLYSISYRTTYLCCRPRYLMLMRDLLKKTPEWHSDHNNLLRVVDLVQASTDQINEAVRKREKLDEITSLSREFHGDPGFVAAGRVYVRILVGGWLSA